MARIEFVTPEEQSLPSTDEYFHVEDHDCRSQVYYEREGHLQGASTAIEAVIIEAHRLVVVIIVGFLMLLSSRLPGHDHRGGIQLWSCELSDFGNKVSAPGHKRIGH
jgi:hypothetical protein